MITSPFVCILSLCNCCIFTCLFFSAAFCESFFQSYTLDVIKFSFDDPLWSCNKRYLGLLLWRLVLQKVWCWYTHTIVKKMFMTLQIRRRRLYCSCCHEKLIWQICWSCRGVQYFCLAVRLCFVNSTRQQTHLQREKWKSRFGFSFWCFSRSPYLFWSFLVALKVLKVNPYRQKVPRQLKTVKMLPNKTASL